MLFPLNLILKKSSFKCFKKIQKVFLPIFWEYKIRKKVKCKIICIYFEMFFSAKIKQLGKKGLKHGNAKTLFFM